MGHASCGQANERALCGEMLSRVLVVGEKCKQNQNQSFFREFEIQSCSYLRKVRSVAVRNWLVVQTHGSVRSNDLNASFLPKVRAQTAREVERTNARARRNSNLENRIVVRKNKKKLSLMSFSSPSLFAFCSPLQKDTP